MSGLIKNDSLEDFINKNDKLLSVLGIFVAIVALTISSSSWALGAVAFVSIGGILLLGHTILIKIDKNSQSLQLELFRYILLWGGTAFIIYWVSEFRPLWHIILWVPATVAVFAFIAGSLLPIIRKYNFTRFLFGIRVEQKTWYQKIFRVFSVFLCLSVSLVAGVWIATGTNVIFDAFNK